MPDAVSAWLGKPRLARSVPGGEEVPTLPAPSVSRNKEGKNPIPTSTPVSSTWNALTAPFTSVGQWGSRLTTQRRSRVGDQFNTDTQGLGRGVAGLHLAPGGKAGWWGSAQTRQGESLKSGSGSQGHQGTCRPALGKVSKSGGEHPG